MQDNYTDQTPGMVTGAVACGVAPLPLLGVYSVIFLIHGSIKPVQPPDITSTKQGEFIAGWVSLVLFLVCLVAVLWMLNCTRRWPLALVQLATLGACIDFALDPTKGGALVPSLLILTSAVSLVLMFAPTSWAWIGRAAPGPVQGAADVLARRKPPRQVGQEGHTAQEVAAAPLDTAALPEEMPQPELAQ